MTDTQKPTVSVVIPAHNAAEFLAEALDSVLAQTYRPVEVIVVDDGSEDETPQVAAAYPGKVTYIRKERGGPASARNAGIRAAKREWIAFLDADDIWLPKFLEKLVQGATETGADLVFCDWLTLTNGRVAGPTHLERIGLKTRLDTLTRDGVLLNPFELLLEAGNYILPSTVLIRRNALFETGLFDEGIYCTDDLDLWLRLSLSYRFVVVNEALVFRRIHAANISHDPWARVGSDMQVYEKLERCAPALAPGTRCRRLLQKQKARLFREQGALYLARGELLLAREGWAKGFWASYSPRLAAYWLATYLPQSWRETLRHWKRQIWPVPPSAGYRGQETSNGR